MVVVFFQKIGGARQSFHVLAVSWSSMVDAHSRERSQVVVLFKNGLLTDDSSGGIGTCHDWI
jgi:hypothetical protein